jgi:hypothetical protein
MQENAGTRGLGVKAVKNWRKIIEPWFESAAFSAANGPRRAEQKFTSESNDHRFDNSRLTLVAAALAAQQSEAWHESSLPVRA